MIINWFTNKDCEAAYDPSCADCQKKTQHTAGLVETPCNKHQLEYAGELVTVIKVEFLDPDKPEVGKKYINTLILDPKENLEHMIDHIQAEEFENRTCVVSLTTEQITRDEFNTMHEWEP